MQKTKTIEQTIPHFSKYKTFEDACGFTGDDPTDKKFSEGPEDEVALRRCKVITLALNGGEVLTFKDKTTKKWIPYFIWDGSGFRFYSAYCVNSLSYSGAGSRLAFLDEHRAIYAGEQFLHEYTPMI